MKKNVKVGKLSEAHWIEKSNALNEVRNSHMTVTQARFLAIYLSKINARKPESREVTFTLDEYARIMEFKRANTTRLQKTAEDILKIIVKFYDKDGSYSEDGLVGFVMCQLFKRFKLFKGEDDRWYIHVDCHDDVMKLLFELRGYYFKYQLWNTLRLTSTNQQRMYEILKQYEKAGARDISVRDLREFLGIKPDEYPKWADFRRYVLESAQNALSDYTDLKFTWEIPKRGKHGKITHLKFHIEHNTPENQQITLQEYLLEQAAPEVEEEELIAFDYENEAFGFLAEACENKFNEEQMEELFLLLGRIVPFSESRAKTELARFDYLHEKYTYAKHRAKQDGKLFNYLKKVLEEAAHENN